jgi:histidyl-tRNA synthetase
MSKPTPLSGFPELLPEQRAVEQQVLDTLREVFELHGFASVETRAVEPLDQLLRKGETDKEIYVLRRLQAEPEEPAQAGGDATGSTLGLHFDLTVPLARYVLENAGHLEFPFRRYQLQKAWRGERPQEGRDREFVQADIDVIGRDTLSFHHEIEVAQVMADAFARLPFPPVRMQVNSRRLIEGYYLGLGVTPVQVAEVMRVIDKIDKVTPDVVVAMLVEEVGLSSEQAEACVALTAVTADGDDLAGKVKDLGVSHDLLDEGVDELSRVLRGTAALRSDRFSVVADLRIARGLDYYTGTVYETRMTGFEHLGSICSGGRYDALATDGRTTYPGVGISLGLSRVLVPLLTRTGLVADRSVPSAVLVALTEDTPDARAAAEAVAEQLRERDVACEVAPTAAKFGKQIRFAERRGIPYVWFLPRPAAPVTRDPDGADAAPEQIEPADPTHEVKDIRSGEQVAADPATWTPPTEDLRPRVLTEEQQP